MAIFNLPGGRKFGLNTSKLPSGGRKTKTAIFSFKGKRGSAKKK